MSEPINFHLLRCLFPNASAATLKLNNPDDDHQAAPRLPDAEPAQQARALEQDDARKAQGTRRPLVCFVLRRVKLLDTDAKWGSIKDLLDGLAYAGIIPGDREEEIRLHVEQEAVKTYAQEATVITITWP